jgi:hypothetical protein
MNRALALAGGVLLAPGIAHAQRAVAPAQSGVIVYGPEFFAGTALDTALEMLQRLPGFAIDFGNTDARGLAGSGGNVLIGGKPPASKTDSLAQILSRITFASVERVELIRGGAPGIDMQGRAVVANIVLKRVESTEKVLGATAYVYSDAYVGPQISGQYTHRKGDDREELAISATTDRTSGTAWGRRTRTDAGGALLQRASLDLWDRYRNANARGNLQRRAGGGTLQLNALVDYTNLNSSQSIDILPAIGTDDYNQDVTHTWSGELSADWTRPLGSKAELQLTALQRISNERYDSSTLSGGTPSTFASTDTDGETIVRALLKYRPAGKWAFEGGGEFVYNFLDSHSDYTELGAAVALPNAEVFVDELRGEGFGQATWQPSSRLTIEAGLRVELSRIAQRGDTFLSKSFTYPKPRFQLTWRPAKGHQLRLRLEKKVGQLDFGDFAASTEINLGTVVGGNADLVPQKSLAIEGVYEYRFWDKGAIELTARHNIYDDVIDLIPLAGGYDAVGNIGSGTLETLEGRLTLPFDKLGIRNARLTARGTWQRSRVTDPLTGARRRLSGEIPFGCSVGFSHDLKGGRFTYGVDHGCNVDHYDLYRVRELRTIANEPQLTLYGQWKPNRTLTLRLDLGNATDARSMSLRTVHAGPRNTAPILFRERRETWHGQYLFLQLRKVL